MDKYEEEMKKLRDLEFDFNIALLSRQEPEIIKLAKGKYLKQINKVRKMQKPRSKKQNN